MQQGVNEKSSKKSSLGVGTIIAVLLIMIGVLIVVMSVFKFMNHGDSKVAYATAEATITKVKSSVFDNKTVCRLDYEFNAEDGRTYTNSRSDDTDLSTYDTDNCYKIEGQTVSIKYDPTYPSDNELGASETVNITSFIGDIAMLPIGLLLIAIGIYSLNSAKKMQLQQQPNFSNMQEAQIISETRDEYTNK